MAADDVLIKMPPTQFVQASDIKKGIPDDDVIDAMAFEDDDDDLLDAADTEAPPTSCCGQCIRVVLVMLLFACVTIVSYLAWGLIFSPLTRPDFTMGVQIVSEERAKQMLQEPSVKSYEEGQDPLNDPEFLQDSHKAEVLHRIRDHVSKKTGDILWQQQVNATKDVYSLWKLSMIVRRANTRYKEVNLNAGGNAEMKESNYQVKLVIGA